jgi:hypothetical protein
MKWVIQHKRILRRLVGCLMTFLVLAIVSMAVQYTLDMPHIGETGKTAVSMAMGVTTIWAAIVSWLFITGKFDSRFDQLEANFRTKEQDTADILPFTKK